MPGFLTVRRDLWGPYLAHTDGRVRPVQPPDHPWHPAQIRLFERRRGASVRTGGTTAFPVGAKVFKRYLPGAQEFYVRDPAGRVPREIWFLWKGETMAQDNANGGPVTITAQVTVPPWFLTEVEAHLGLPAEHVRVVCAEAMAKVLGEMEAELEKVDPEFGNRWKRWALGGRLLPPQETPT